MNKTTAACAVPIAATVADTGAKDSALFAEVKDTWRITAHPGYSPRLDRDGDGVACERGKGK
ncbi:excalibur calcium-binding domain-containing protein (plasmid) [Ensifer adhaerens]|uniref:excalibur calcium-binding domain-containing protein n=1 Tax=Ensifer adhaerens TaxID=106592 RepID=UPI0023A941EE|nr:excalibur calcium-binding domain-containing protein [Ensifer adhaerens]WDZ80413.1 excalibur calcium-binding domain-containing protein [Ensifer adhaerens]